MPDLNPFINSLLQNQYFFIALVFWSLIWKGLSLWKAARLNQKIWFTAILVVNTMGLFEIAYLLVLYKIDLNKKLSFLKKLNLHPNKT